MEFNATTADDIYCPNPEEYRAKYFSQVKGLFVANTKAKLCLLRNSLLWKHKNSLRSEHLYKVANFPLCILKLVFRLFHLQYFRTFFGFLENPENITEVREKKVFTNILIPSCQVTCLILFNCQDEILKTNTPMHWLGTVADFVYLIWTECLSKNCYDCLGEKLANMAIWEC